MDDVCYVEEFSFSELVFLNQFVHIVGVHDDSVEIAVQAIYTEQDTIWTCSWITGASIGYGTTEDVIQRKRQEGYLIDEDFDLYNPKLAMRYGAKIIVTDRGSLLYCKPGSRKRLVLGEFCSKVRYNSLRGDYTAEYVFDRRIVSVDSDFYGLCDGVITCDVTKANPEIVRKMKILHHNNQINARW